MRRVKGSRALVAEVIRKAKACESCLVEVARSENATRPGVRLCYSMIAADYSRDVFASVRELDQLGAFA